MSPSEFDLRAALHAGEGDGVDADRVIARAVEFRHHRRVRWATTAATVAVVAGIGVGGTAVLSHTSTQQDAASGSSTAFQPASGGGKAATAGPEAGRAPAYDAASLPCPATPPQLMLPGGGGSGQFGSTGSLFSGPVSTIKVCGYPHGTRPAPPETTLTGTSAQQLADGIDAASAVPRRVPCPSVPPGYLQQLVLLPIGTNGQQMDPIVASLQCNGTTTNGTALRYDWQPPASLSQFIASLRQLLPVDASPSMRFSGSPVH